MSAVCEAAEQLAELLERENAALQRLDLPSATALLGAKRAALAVLEQAARGQAQPLEPTVAMRAAAIRLRDASQDNKRLLERAMIVQQHVMSLLAQAARKAAPAPRYGAGGGYAASHGSKAFALSARA